MKIKQWIILAAAFIPAAACKKPDDGKNILVLKSSFEGTDPFAGWENDQHCCDYSLIQSTDKATDGSSSMKIYIDSTDRQTSGSIRSELVQKSDPVGTERWYGFNMYLENWTDDNAGEHVFQWHPDNSSGTATAALWTSGGRYVFETNTSGGSAGNEYTDLGPVLSDEWVSWVIHVKWSADNTGIMQIWKNGTLMMDKSRIITAPQIGTYFKLGINKFGWGNQASTVKERILYFDDITIGTAKAKYADVKPGN